MKLKALIVLLTSGFSFAAAAETPTIVQMQKYLIQAKLVESVQEAIAGTALEWANLGVEYQTDKFVIMGKAITELSLESQAGKLSDQESRALTSYRVQVNFVLQTKGGVLYRSALGALVMCLPASLDRRLTRKSILDAEELGQVISLGTESDKACYMSTFSHEAARGRITKNLSQIERQ